MLNEQKHLPEAYIAQASEIIQEKVLSMKQYRAAQSVFLYVSTDREPSTLRLLRHALESGKSVYVPKCINCLDLMLVPCVCASLDGKRLGHGAGYYDRFLAEKAEHAVCLCFHRMIRDDIPITDNDAIIPMVLTEEE